mgnify:CR=1 FL=1
MDKSRKGLRELVSTIHIIVVGIVADDDTRVLHHVLDEAEAWNLRIRKSLIGVGSIIDFHKFRFISYDYILFQYLLNLPLCSLWQQLVQVVAHQLVGFFGGVGTLTGFDTEEFFGSALLDVHVEPPPLSSHICLAGGRFHC